MALLFQTIIFICIQTLKKEIFALQELNIMVYQYIS